MKTRRHAFTLMEMLIAMAIMSVLAGALYSALRTTFTARSSADRALAAPGHTIIALSIIGRDLAEAVPPTTQV